MVQYVTNQDWKQSKEITGYLHSNSNQKLQIAMAMIFITVTFNLQQMQLATILYALPV
jgi:hypothetical protein